MHIAVATVDYHYPRIMKLIWSNLPAHEIIRSKPKPPLPSFPPETVQQLATNHPELLEQVVEAIRGLSDGA